jgi:hypothetical protein
MKKLLIFTLSFMLLTIWIGASSAVDIKGKKTDAVIEIETDMYKLEWKTARQAGYISAWVKDRYVQAGVENREPSRVHIRVGKEGKGQ